MDNSRRNFLKIAGVTALGVGAVTVAGKAVGSYLPDMHRAEPHENALTAKRWGMVIDSRRFTTVQDFQPLIDACHKTHNVPNIPGKQEVKWLWYDTFEHVFPHKHDEFQAHNVEDRQYLLLCNHCDEPPCVRVCPTKATFKRDDGIVMMDMHRCIGCRFCMAACPFGSRSFNFRDPRPFIKDEDRNREFPTRMKGVVEKCNFCAELLAVGKQPACVEASGGALVFGDLGDPDSEIRHVLHENYTIRRKPDLGTNPSVSYII
jgi:Fe-S-cluster-containing dehydrogenase component